MSNDCNFNMKIKGKKEEIEKENGEYCICEVIDALVKENPNTLESINLSTMYIYE